jgi:hypothetical protein
MLQGEIKTLEVDRKEIYVDECSLSSSFGKMV